MELQLEQPAQLCRTCPRVPRSWHQLGASPYLASCRSTDMGLARMVIPLLAFSRRRVPEQRPGRGYKSANYLVLLGVKLASRRRSAELQLAVEVPVSSLAGLGCLRSRAAAGL